MGARSMPIPKYKEDFIVCSGCFCCNNYCLMPTTCCAQESVFLCCAGDAACLPVPPQTPKMCGIIIPGLMCYPKFGCCITVKDMFEGEEEVLRGIDDIKEKFHACGGCCLGPLCANNAYCLMPFTCCYGEEQCLCCARDWPSPAPRRCLPRSPASSPASCCTPRWAAARRSAMCSPTRWSRARQLPLPTPAVPSNCGSTALPGCSYMP